MHAYVHVCTHAAPALLRPPSLPHDACGRPLLWRPNVLEGEPNSPQDTCLTILVPKLRVVRTPPRARAPNKKEKETPPRAPPLPPPLNIPDAGRE